MTIEIKDTPFPIKWKREYFTVSCYRADQPLSEYHGKFFVLTVELWRIRMQNDGTDVMLTFGGVNNGLSYNVFDLSKMRIGTRIQKNHVRYIHPTREAAEAEAARLNAESEVEG